MRRLEGEKIRSWENEEMEGVRSEEQGVRSEA